MVLVLTAAAAFVGAEVKDQAFVVRSTLFAYDVKADMAFKTIGSERRDKVTVDDISFVALPGRSPLKAYLVTPDGPGPFAGALWVHWLGEEKSDSSQFLDEAVALASKGVISLLINGMWSDPDWYEKRVPEEDFENSIRQVIEIRRAMDLLLARPTLDKARVAFIGHDFGGMYGAIAAGLDRKAKTYVFIAVAPSLNDWAFFARQPVSKVEYIRQNAVLELTDYLARLDNASVLCQFAKNDPYIASTGGYVFFNAIASTRKERRSYDAGHAMAVAAIAAERDAWLAQELGLK